MTGVIIQSVLAWKKMLNYDDEKKINEPSPSSLSKLIVFRFLFFALEDSSADSKLDVSSATLDNNLPLSYVSAHSKTVNHLHNAGLYYKRQQNYK